MVDGNSEIQPEEGIPEDSNNIVLGKPFATALLGFLDTLPRKDVNDFCVALEQAPTVGDFKKQVKEFYDKSQGVSK